MICVHFESGKLSPGYKKAVFILDPGFKLAYQYLAFKFGPREYSIIVVRRSDTNEFYPPIDQQTTNNDGDSVCSRAFLQK